jgi:hypothetical protein
MNKTYFFRFVLIALFLLAYQSSTVHSSKHLLQKVTECHECLSSEQFEHTVHKTVFPSIVESHSTESENITQRVTLKQSIDFTQRPLVKQVDFTGLQNFSISPIPLGYLSTAPPTIFS